MSFSAPIKTGTDENVLETEETPLMVSGNQAGPKAPSESGKACPELQNVKKIQWPGGKTEISFHQHLKCDIFSQIGYICEFCDIVQLCAYLSNRGRLRRSFGVRQYPGNSTHRGFSATLSATPMRRCRDACGFHRFIRAGPKPSPLFSGC